jgi:hypothetical protein
MGVFMRWFGAFVLLAATFNPTPYNYLRWTEGHWETELPLTVFLGVVLTIGYIIYIGATLRSLGGFGLLLIAALFASAIWVLIDWGILALGNTDLNVWLGIFGLSVILGIGLSWSILWQRMSGQASVDEIEG